MEIYDQLSSTYAVSVPGGKCGGCDITMLARKVDAGTACPPFAFIVALRALIDMREIHNTGLSFEKVKGVTSLLLLWVVLLKCGFECRDAEFAGKRAKVQGTPSTEDKKVDM
jgi:hypothetical protein